MHVPVAPLLPVLSQPLWITPTLWHGGIPLPVDPFMFRRPLSGASPQVPTPTRRAKLRCFRDCCSAVACKIVRHEGTHLRRRMGLCCHTVAHVPTSKGSKGARGPISYGGLRLKASALNYCVALASIRPGASEVKSWSRGIPGVGGGQNGAWCGSRCFHPLGASGELAISRTRLRELGQASTLTSQDAHVCGSGSQSHPQLGDGSVCGLP